MVLDVGTQPDWHPALRSRLSALGKEYFSVVVQVLPSMGWRHLASWACQGNPRSSEGFPVARRPLHTGTTPSSATLVRRFAPYHQLRRPHRQRLPPPLRLLRLPCPRSHHHLATDPVAPLRGANSPWWPQWSC